MLRNAGNVQNLGMFPIEMHRQPVPVYAASTQPQADPMADTSPAQACWRDRLDAEEQARLSLEVARSSAAECQQIHVRAVRLSDWPTLHRMVPQLFPEVDAVTLGYWLRSGRHVLLIAEVDRQLAGFCHLRVRRQGNVLWINYLGVLPEQRRCGVGRALLQGAHNRASEWGCMRIELDVVTRNDGAMGLYDRAGYRCISTLYDDEDRLKYRYRKDIRLGRVEQQSLPGLPSGWQRLGLKLLYEAWIASPPRLQDWLGERRKPVTDKG